MHDELVHKGDLITTICAACIAKDICNKDCKLIGIIKHSIPRKSVSDITAHWIRQDNTYTKYMCSRCRTKNYAGHENYCPMCGARMIK